MNFQIPKRLQVLLDESPHRGAVLSTIRNFADWLDNSLTPFFPNYTKHDMKHIQDVLASCNDLIHEEALVTLTPNDVCVLIASCLLHDCAMHLTEEGFTQLISTNSSWCPISPFDTRSWDIEWLAFLSEARRFDGKKLIQLFGTPDPISPPPADIGQWTEQHRKLIGEFIRRHHTALAHQFARFGLPSAGSQSKPLLPHLGNTIADLAGLVARSHGHNLRMLFPYLSEHYDLRDYQGIHVIYLMTLLRIADFMQIQSGRAPSEVLELRSLRSPLSESEWRVHAATQAIAPAFDPEAVHVITRPTSAADFVRIRSWLDGIQSELDHSWAILGEVYGRFDKEHLDGLQLTLRRITSNIDDRDAFSLTVPYLPEKIEFRTAGTDLLKLLIRPLYSDNPAAGIRELVQNAVDSVREMEFMLGTGRVAAGLDRYSINSDVKIAVEYNEEDRPCSFTIVDKGTGMTEEILRDYFLNIGASFRNSDLWRSVYLNSNDNSQVVRSGRFGIGVLAAYLIGPEIEIETRHFSRPPEKALRFRATIDDDIIEVRYCSARVGTTIKIKIAENAHPGVAAFLQSFAPAKQWHQHKISDVYRAAYPSLSVQVTKHDDTVQAFEVPEPQPTERDWFKYPWRTFKTRCYPRVHWTDRSDKPLTYNGLTTGSDGLFASSSAHRNRHFEIGSLFHIPRLAVSDPDGQLPLDLARTGLLHFPEEIRLELEKAFIRDIFCRSLYEFPALVGAPAPEHTSDWSFSSDNIIKSWIFGKCGFAPKLGPLLTTWRPRRVWFAPAKRSVVERLIKSTLLQSNDAVMLYSPKTSFWGVWDFIRALKKEYARVLYSPYTSGWLWSRNLDVVDLSFCLANQQMQLTSSAKGTPKYINAMFAETTSLTETFSCRSAVEDRDALRSVFQQEGPWLDGYLSGLFWWDVRWRQGRENTLPEDVKAIWDADDRITKEWTFLSDELLVPYDFKKREALILRAQTVVRDYLEYWQTDAEQRRRKSSG